MNPSVTESNTAPPTSQNLSPEEARDLSFGLLRSWWLAATQALVDEAGNEASLRCLKPYFTNTGMAGAHNIATMQGISAKELIRRDTIGFVWPLVTGGRTNVYLAPDDSSIYETEGCATGGICKEGCISLCEFINNAGVGELNPGFEAVLLESLSFGDPTCHVTFRSAGRKSMVAPTPEFKVPDDKRPAPPEEELKEYLALSIIGEAWSNATRAFVDFAGQERARDRLRFHMRHAGLSFGIRMSSRFDARERGLRSILKAIELVQLLHRRKGPCIMQEASVEGTVTECPFSSSSPEMCYQYEAFFNGLCEAIDPSFAFVYDRMMTVGEETCHWHIGKKGSAITSAGKEVLGTAEDALSILKARFAKGEITEEQYRRQRDIMLER
jgi:hypothetical protein